MDKRKVLAATDSGANLPEGVAERLGIEVIPLWVQMGERSFRDGIDLRPLEFFRRLRERVEQVKTSQPSLGEFLEFYRKLQEKAEAIVSIHVTSRYSGVVSVAQAAAAELAPFPIEVVDTGTVAMAQGFAAMAAARVAAAGASLKEVVEKARSAISRIDLVAALDTLEYVVRGGRLAWAARLMDGLLRVKPILRVRDNQVNIIGQARTRAKAIRRLLSELSERAGDATVHVAVLYSDTIDEARRLHDDIVARLRCAEVYLTPVTPVLGVHAGPGVLGLAYYVED